VADRGIREGILRGLMSADADAVEAQAALRRLKQNGSKPSGLKPNGLKQNGPKQNER
jgi:hypothetical protein